MQALSGDITLAASASGVVLLATPTTVAARLASATPRDVPEAGAVTEALQRLGLPPLSPQDLAAVGFSFAGRREL